MREDKWTFTDTHQWIDFLAMYFSFQNKIFVNNFFSSRKFLLKMDINFAKNHEIFAKFSWNFRFHESKKVIFVQTLLTAIPSLISLSPSSCTLSYKSPSHSFSYISFFFSLSLYILLQILLTILSSLFFPIPWLTNTPFREKRDLFPTEKYSKGHTHHSKQ